MAGSSTNWLKVAVFPEKITEQGNSCKNYFISSKAMLIKKDVFREIGLFDERFIFSLYDLDFCLRARRKGFDSKLVPTVTVWQHSEKMSFYEGVANEEYQKNFSEILFFRKNSPVLLKPWIFFRLWLKKINIWKKAKLKRSKEYQTHKEVYADWKKIN